MTQSVHTHLSIAPTKAGPLAARGGSDPYDTELVELQRGADWCGAGPGTDVQVLVVDGKLNWGTRELKQGSFLRMTWSEDAALRSAGGCRLLIKTGPMGYKEESAVVVDPSTSAWSPGQGNLRVLALDSRGGESTALVHWPAGEHFLPHRHLGGEEVFVLSGAFLDEHGTYPAGSWIQSPHGSVHDPFVLEETRIWVKTGHLPPIKAR